MKFGWRYPGLAGVLLALLLAACRPADQSPPARHEAAPRSVRVGRVELRPMERTLPVVGTLSARDEATVSAQVAGQIEKNHVDFGDRVTAGQELVLIDVAAYEALVRQSAANLARATASAANAAQNLKRAQELQKEKIASTSDLELAVAESGKTQADVKAVEAADAIARLNLERSRVRAPFAGAVAQRLVSVGDYVAIGTPILRLIQTDPLRLRLEVPERESVAVRPGQDVRLTVDGDTNTYPGRLVRIAPAIRESDRTLLVEADVPNQGGLRAGLFARVRIIVNPGEPALSIPPNALIAFAGIEKVVVVRDGKAAEKTVTTSRRGAGWIEILSGVSEGETVVLDPAGIRTGQPLTIENAGDAAPANKGKTEGGR